LNPELDYGCLQDSCNKTTKTAIYNNLCWRILNIACDGDVTFPETRGVLRPHLKYISLAAFFKPSATGAARQTEAKPKRQLRDQGRADQAFVLNSVC